MKYVAFHTQPHSIIYINPHYIESFWAGEADGVVRICTIANDYPIKVLDHIDDVVKMLESEETE